MMKYLETGIAIYERNRGGRKCHHGRNAGEKVQGRNTLTNVILKSETRLPVFMDNFYKRLSPFGTSSFQLRKLNTSAGKISVCVAENGSTQTTNIMYYFGLRRHVVL
jgi:hypothetical protein